MALSVRNGADSELRGGTVLSTGSVDRLALEFTRDERGRLVYLLHARYHLYRGFILIVIGVLGLSLGLFAAHPIAAVIGSTLGALCLAIGATSNESEFIRGLAKRVGRRSELVGTGRCPNCGYSLLTLPSVAHRPELKRCPECGDFDLAPGVCLPARSLNLLDASECKRSSRIMKATRWLGYLWNGLMVAFGLYIVAIQVSTVFGVAMIGSGLMRSSGGAVVGLGIFVVMLVHRYTARLTEQELRKRRQRILSKEASKGEGRI